MTQPPSASSGGSAPLSLGQRFVGMLTAPKATYESVVSWPRWLGMLAITTAITTVVMAAFLFSSAGTEIIREQMMAQGNAQPEQVERMLPIIKGFQVGIMPIAIPVVTVIMAGVLMGFFAITGGTASFKQVLAVVVHSGVVSTLIGVANIVVNWVRGSATNVTSLAGLAQAFDEHSFPAYVLTALDLAMFFSLFILAIGLGVLYRRRTGTIFAGLSAAYLIIALVIGGVRAALGGS